MLLVFRLYDDHRVKITHCRLQKKKKKNVDREINNLTNGVCCEREKAAKWKVRTTP